MFNTTTQTEFPKHIWGLWYDDMIVDGMNWRKIHIKKSFYYLGSVVVGINEKFLRDSWINGVMKLVLFIGEEQPYKEKIIDVPSKKMIEKLEKLHYYEDRPSIKEGGQPMRIYYIRI